MGIFPEMLKLCVEISCGSILHSNSYYTVVAGILVPSATSYKTIHRVKSVTILSHQPFCLQ